MQTESAEGVYKESELWRDRSDFQHENAKRLVSGCFSSPMSFDVPLKEIQRVAGRMREGKEKWLELYDFIQHNLLQKARELVRIFGETRDFNSLSVLVDGAFWFAKFLPAFYHEFSLYLGSFLKNLPVERKIIISVFSDLARNHASFIVELHSCFFEKVVEINQECLAYSTHCDLESFLEIKSEMFSQISRMCNLFESLGQNAVTEQVLVDAYKKVWIPVFDKNNHVSFEEIYLLFLQQHFVHDSMLSKFEVKADTILHKITECFCFHVMKKFQESLPELLARDKKEIITFFSQVISEEMFKETLSIYDFRLQKAKTVLSFLDYTFVLLEFGALLKEKSYNPETVITELLKKHVAASDLTSPSLFRKFIYENESRTVSKLMPAFKKIFPLITAKSEYFEMLYREFLCYKITNSSPPAILQDILSYWRQTYSSHDIIRSFNHLSLSTFKFNAGQEAMPLELIEVDANRWSTPKISVNYDIKSLVVLPWIQPHLSDFSYSNNPRKLIEIQTRFCSVEVKALCEGGDTALLTLNLEQMALTLWRNSLDSLTVADFHSLTGIDDISLKRLIKSLNARGEWVRVEGPQIIVSRLPSSFGGSAINLAAEYFAMLFEGEEGGGEEPAVEEAPLATDKVLRAAIVCLAKQCEGITLSQLKQQLSARFSFTDEQLGSGVQSLIEEEFLERPAANPEQLKYI